MSRLRNRLLKRLLYLLLVLVLALPVAELFLRLEERLVWATGDIRSGAGLRAYGSRLNRRLWKMFLEAGSTDLRVLPGNASTAHHLPPGGKWSAVDFLLPEERREASRFAVTSDSRGFRGAEKKLSNKDYRVLVLGSYQAFGHGVGDQETYSALLEERLKRSPKLKRKGLRPVVFNGGMQSASLERGVKVLEERLDELKPGLVILDYGMTDQVSAGMNPWLQPFAAVAKPGTALYERLDRFSRLNSTGPVGASYLFQHLVGRAMEENLEPNRRRFAEGLGKVIGELELRGVLVLLLDQPMVGVPAELYERVAGGYSNAGFLSVKALLEGKGREKPAEGALWLEEFPPSFRAFFQKKTGLAPYLGNMLHVNRAGHAEIAGALAAWVEENGVRP